MARKLERLSVKAVAAKRLPGYYADGGGLYLQVSLVDTKSWIFRFTLSGKTRDMGLGPLHTIGLADARSAAADCRKLLLNNIDPIEARKQGRVRLALEAASSKTFDECAAAYIKSKRAGWKNAKHAEQWENTLETYASPVIGALPVQTVDTALVMRVLEPIWTSKQETATRVRGRVEAVINWATTRGYRSGENPARWRGHLQNLLPNLKSRYRVEHHAALSFDEIAGFVLALRSQEGGAARALEFLILTAARTGEVIDAKPEEFDLEAKVWTIPAGRMKAGREHRVPLSPRAVEIVREMVKQKGEYVFPGQNEGKPLSNMAMLQLLKRMDRADITVHGFRSSFRDWAAERTIYPREVCEMALAHAVGNQVEAAYRRGDLFEKRRRLMLEWAKHCDTIAKKGDVVPMRAKGKA